MSLPLPTLQARDCAGLSFLTDEPLFAACGVRMGFTRRSGGVSEAPYDSLNLGSHVEDRVDAVTENRARLLQAVGLAGTRLVVPNQVHGSEVLSLSMGEGEAVERLAEVAAEGADGLAIAAAGVTALLCFADCVPVVVVSPTGAFAVAHAGWRGALAGIPAKAVAALAALDAAAGSGQISPSDYNGYIGPHIMAKCYECSEELVSCFAERFGDACAYRPDHLNLQAAVTASLQEGGLATERIAAAGECTLCNGDKYFSYRGSGGRCGRHGAFAGRKE